MALARNDEPDDAPATVPSAPPAAPPTEWVDVTHKSVPKGTAPGRVSREWLDGWGKDQGWTEVK